MRISDWSSDVCSSDLLLAGELRGERGDPARLLLEEHRMHLGGVELGAARGLGDGIVQIAEAVDQLELARGAAVPHAALRDLVDTLGRQLARLADARDELAIAVLDPRLEDRVHLRIGAADDVGLRSEEHTSELQSLMRISYAVFFLKKKK